MILAIWKYCSSSSNQALPCRTKHFSIHTYQLLDHIRMYFLFLYVNFFIFLFLASLEWSSWWIMLCAYHGTANLLVKIIHLCVLWLLCPNRNYWRDPDTALFILKHLYRDVPEEPDSPGQSEAGCGSRKQNGPAGLYFDRDDADEDLPLTFSDHLMIREFSRKAKKAMTSG